MACVLTLALVEDGEITIGHVGDSRLYLVWNGAIRKLTSDHSPVGEDEDAGELTEEEAMLHPRRNEVFRDVGSRRRSAADEEFIEIRQCRFRPDAAILLCSDGLTDQLTAAEVREIVERYDGDAARVAANWWTPPTRPAGATISRRCSWRGRIPRRSAGTTPPAPRPTDAQPPSARRGCCTGRAGISGLRTAARACCCGRCCGCEGDAMTAPHAIGRYEIVRRLGKSMTDVYLAIDTVENRKAALKLIQPGGDRAIAT